MWATSLFGQTIMGLKKYPLATVQVCIFLTMGQILLPLHLLNFSSMTCYVFLIFLQISSLCIVLLMITIACSFLTPLVFVLRTKLWGICFFEAGVKTVYIPFHLVGYPHNLIKVEELLMLVNVYLRPFGVLGSNIRHLLFFNILCLAFSYQLMALQSFHLSVPRVRRVKVKSCLSLYLPLFLLTL